MKWWIACIALAVLFMFLLSRLGHAESGMASYYHEGARTANGERYRPDGITAAHRTFAFGTRLHVCRSGGRCVTVRVNDRGPAKWTGRIIDLSRGAARAIGITHAMGVARVTVSRVR